MAPVYAVRFGPNASEQRFAYRQHELYDENVPSDDEDDATETVTFSFLVVGDQNAGKSTFLHTFSKFADANFTRLQSFLPTISSAFVNQCFAEAQLNPHSPTAEEEHPQHRHDPPGAPERKRPKVDADEHPEERRFGMRAGATHEDATYGDEHAHVIAEEDVEVEEGRTVEVVDTSVIPTLCDEAPYLDTDLGTATLVLTAEAFTFFLSEFGLWKTEGGAPPEKGEQRPNFFAEKLRPTTCFVQLKLHEIGGDHLDRVMRVVESTATSCGSTSTAATTYLRDATVRESVRVLQKATKLIYFVNARSYFEEASQPALLQNRIRFLGKLCTKCEDAVFYCSRTESVGHHVLGSLEDEGLDEDYDECNVDGPRADISEVPTLEPFEDEYGAEWAKERECLRNMETSGAFRRLRRELCGLWGDHAEGTWSAPGDRLGEPHAAATEQDMRPRFRCGGVHATKNLNADGSIAVCSVVLVLLRMLSGVMNTSASTKAAHNDEDDAHCAESERRSSCNSKNEPGININMGTRTRTSRGSSTGPRGEEEGREDHEPHDVGVEISETQSFPEFLDLFVACSRFYRSVKGEDYLSEMHWKSFIADKLIVSPDVPRLWRAGGVELLKRTGLVRRLVYEEGTEFLRFPSHPALFELLVSDGLRPWFLRRLREACRWRITLSGDARDDKSKDPDVEMAPSGSSGRPGPGPLLGLYEEGDADAHAARCTDEGLAARLRTLEEELWDCLLGADDLLQLEEWLADLKILDQMRRGGCCGGQEGAGVFDTQNGCIRDPGRRRRVDELRAQMEAKNSTTF